MVIFLNNSNSCDSLGRVKALSAALQKQKASCTHSSSVWFCIIVASPPLLLRTKEASPAHPSSQMYRCTWGWVPDPQEVIFCLSFLRHCPQEHPPTSCFPCLFSSLFPSLASARSLLFLEALTCILLSANWSPSWSHWKWNLSFCFSCCFWAQPGTYQFWF